MAGLIFLEEFFSKFSTFAVLTFFLVFVIIYSVLNRIKIFKEKKGISVTLAVVVALTTVIPHFTGKFLWFDVVRVMEKLLPYTSLIVIFFFLCLLVLSAFGIKMDKSWFLKILGLLVIIDLMVPDVLILVLILGELPHLPPWLSFLNFFIQPEIRIALLTLIIMAAIIFFITYEKKKK